MAAKLGQDIEQNMHRVLLPSWIMQSQMGVMMENMFGTSFILLSFHIHEIHFICFAFHSRFMDPLIRLECFCLLMDVNMVRIS